MIDKINSINAGNSQNKRVSDEIRDKETNIKVSKDTQTNSEKTNDQVQISSELKVKDMSAEAPIDSVKVSAIKDAISRGAKAIVYSGSIKKKYSNIILIKVTDPRSKLAEISSKFYSLKPKNIINELTERELEFLDAIKTLWLRRKRSKSFNHQFEKYI